MTYSLGPSCIDMMKAPSAQNTSLLPPPLATSPSSALSPFTWQRSTRYQSAIFVFAYKHSRDISLPTKVCIVKAMVFPVITHVCESWAIQKAECWRTDAFELWCWRFLRVPWTARRSNQSILKEINPKYSLEGLLLKLKLQYFGHLIRRADSLRKDPDAGKDWRQEAKGTTEYKMVGWHHRLDGHELEQTQEMKDRKAWHAAIHGFAKSQTQLSNWTTINIWCSVALSP